MANGAKSVRGQPDEGSPRHAAPRAKETTGRTGIVHGALAALFDESPVGIAVLDAGGVVLAANETLAALLGRVRDGLVGRPFAEMIALEDRDDVSAKLALLLMRTTPRVALEGVRLAADGPRERAATLVAAPVIDQGVVAGLLVHAVDGTERRELEARFVHGQRLQALGQLAGGIAHDFNNLIAGMLGFCDLLLSRSTPVHRDYDDLLQIRGGALRARELVRQLLAFARRQPLRPSRVRVDAAIEALLPMLRSLLGPAIAVETMFEATLPRVRIDPGRLDQVIVNLATNARDAMPDGGRLQVSATAVVLHEPAVCRGEPVAAGGYVRIDVADSGCGIPREALDRIFEPFFTTKPAGAGTGLGLATVWGIIRQSGGHLDVDSAAGAGARFSILLPADTAAEDASPLAAHVADAAAAPPSTEPAGSADAASRVPGDPCGRTVMVVDDEAAIRSFVARALRSRGYAVIEAEDGEQALELLAAEPAIDLLITDLALPGADGQTLVAAALSRFADARAIVISAHLDAADVWAEGREQRVSSLPKPFTLAELTAAVRSAVDR
jgi:two-component system, cell cycle sensor histidine kinase and response regulator CckA